MKWGIYSSAGHRLSVNGVMDFGSPRDAEEALKAALQEGGPHTGTLVNAEVRETDHAPHYGGADNPYEAIKVIEAWGLGFNLGNVLKYIARAGKKPGASHIEDLRKARFYLDREIERIAAGK